MAGNDIRKKQKRVTDQGYSAARQNKIQPWELNNVPGDRWEDAKVYSRETRQGQNYAQGRMQEDAARKRKQAEIADRLLKKKRR